MNRPIARPIGSSAGGPTAQQAGGSGAETAPDIYGLPSPSIPSSEPDLTERDLLLLRLVDRFRLLTAGHFRVLVDARSDAAGRALRRRLLRLSGGGYLQRLDRRVGGVRGGSDGYIYVLGRSGQRLLHPDKTRTRRYREPGWPFLRHTLAISEAYVHLVAAARTGSITLRRFDPEPHSWRTQPHGKVELHLRPDAFAIVEQRLKRQYWFIEVDLGTESRTALRRKMQRYVDWLQTGHEQKHHAGVFPRVFWHTPDSRRHELLTSLTEEKAWPAGLHVTSGLPLSRVEEPP